MRLRGRDGAAGLLRSCDIGLLITVGVVAVLPPVFSCQSNNPTYAVAQPLISLKGGAVTAAEVRPLMERKGRVLAISPTHAYEFSHARSAGAVLL